MINTLRKMLLVACLAAPSVLPAQVCLVSKGKPHARIVLAEDNDVNRKAAQLLQRFVRETSGGELPIVANGRRSKNCVVIGESTNEATDDGYVIDCSRGTLAIKTAGGKGAIYGVAALLEKQLGVDYLAKDFYTLTLSADVRIPQMHVAESPAFRFRQTFSYSNNDSTYRDWMRLQEHREMFAADMWVHTFDRLLPSSVYGKSHPEYYSFINGERRPGNHSQWCLTNPDIFEIVAHRIDSIFKANPNQNMISVSQNDGNDTYCQCPECRKVNEYEGSPAGCYVRFLNRLAERFPDKQFSTLAYLFTMHPPKHVKPLPNVNIMLCDIDTKREVPLTDNESGRDFVRALEGWAKISNNIFVWDYGINFDNVVAPFPNFHILKKNIQLFKRNHATMLFEQVNGTLGTDFAELRAYMLGKLMWNPELDADSLMQRFMRGYYGAAAPNLYRYQQMLTGALLASGTPLWIYDSPITHKNGMLNANLRKAYNELFDEAEKAVAADSAMLAHVRIARLPLRYSELEIARTESGGDKAAVEQALDTFGSICAQYGVPTLNERNNKVDDYCRLYRQRFLPNGTKNKAAGAKVIWNIPPQERYQPIADKALTDGLYGGTTFVESWVGWQGEDADFVLDMGEQKQVNKITTDFLHQLGQWILQPKSVAYYASDDAKNFRLLGTHEFPEDRDISVKFVPATVTLAAPVQARYIRVVVKTLGLCPSWHYGVGYPAWFFLDEVVVE
ncbi:DUF4838 domain-containing protein [Leyella stercorea]|uniref:DUF4838 domain-containing protein n=1 Tax=Leyella stercorea TaxID=363265 RepID=UPI001A641799|nr:DUF4838 domain-containing protein [Leyella stercorea]MBL6517186.1 DUF4838 domain-containing protein [Leyella stercorea]